MAPYNWQQAAWPDFCFDPACLVKPAYEFAGQMGKATGQFELLPDTVREEVLIDVLVSEAIKTSAIEGEFISRQDVVSSLKRNLGLMGNWPYSRDKRSEGMAQLLVLSRTTFDQPLSEQMLFDWHSLLMKGSHGITVGRWRFHAEPMQVISGTIGKEQVHFEAPPSADVPAEMSRFIDWFNRTAPDRPDAIINPLVRAAIAHLYFETIHPFEDGNGRIGRVLAEKALSQTVGQPVLLSLSKTIDADKNAYYTALQRGQRSNEITDWLTYFADVILTAQADFQITLRFVLQKSRFFDTHQDSLNERQRKVIARMFDEGPGGFEGGMNARKYISISKTSKATATRDLQDLVEKQIVTPLGGGRSSRYQLNLGER